MSETEINEVDHRTTDTGPLPPPAANRSKGPAAVTTLSLLVACAAAAYMLSACSSGSVDPEADPAETALGTPDGELRPADEVIEESRRSQAVRVDFSVPVDLDGVSLVVNGVERMGEGGGAGHEASIYLTVRAENRSDSMKARPNLEVRCLSVSEAATSSTWYLTSTYEPYEDLPPGTFADGTLGLGVPAGCESPAVWPEGSTEAFWLLPTSMLQELGKELAYDLIDTLDVSDAVKACMHEVVDDFRLSEDDAQGFEGFDDVASKAADGQERAIQIMNDFQAALATCN